MSASARCRSSSRYERRCPSRRKPAFSRTRCEATLSGTTSASTRANDASVTAHRARRATAREPRPRPRARGISQKPISTVPAFRAVKTPAPSASFEAASAIACESPVPSSSRR
jgi:hypothetical protein